MRRMSLLLLAAACLCVCGCVEGEAVYTINPDGSGKVQMDLVSAPRVLEFGDENNIVPEKVIEDMVGAQFSRARGVTGWSNVSGEFTKDGRFRFRATAYFKKIEELDVDLPEKLTVISAADGSMTLKVKEKEERPGKKKNAAPPDFAKMAEADWANFLLKERIKAQGTKPILGMLADLKMKITIKMPGEITELQDFKPAGKDGAVIDIDVAVLMKEFNRRLTMSDEEMKKFFQSSNASELFGDDTLKSVIVGPKARATVAKPTGPQFDYAKEVAAAVASNAELRKKYKIKDFVKLPGEGPPELVPPKK